MGNVLRDQHCVNMKCMYKCRLIPCLLGHKVSIKLYKHVSTCRYNKILMKCWKIDPELRPDFNELKNIIEAELRWIPQVWETHF